MKNLSQEKIVLEQLDKFGEISRNWCLRNYISRLSAIILDLKEKGFRFETERRGGDYVYKVVRDNLFAK